MFVIGKRLAFSASHIITGVPAGHPCARLHGHNYEVELVAAAGGLDEAGFVHDYHEFDVVFDYVRRTLDHRHLNDVLPGPASAEALAAWLYERSKELLPPEVAACLWAVRVSETPRTWAEYRPGTTQR